MFRPVVARLASHVTAATLERPPPPLWKGACFWVSVWRTIRRIAEPLRADAASCGARQDRCPARCPTPIRPALTGTCNDTPLSMDLTWAGISSGPFDIMHPAGIGRSEAVEGHDEIGAYVGIGVLLDHERRRCVLQINEHGAVARADLPEEARDIGRNLEETLAGRFHRQARRSDSCARARCEWRRACSRRR